MVACQIDGLCYCLFGDSSGLGMWRRSVLVAAAASVMVAAGRGAEVAGFGERLPFSAAEVAALVGGGDGRRGAADVFCDAADVRCRIRCAATHGAVKELAARLVP